MIVKNVEDRISAEDLLELINLQKFEESKEVAS